MFTNMLTSHHPHHPHRPLSPTTSMTSLSAPNYSSEQKFAPLHNAADAMRRMTSPYPVRCRCYKCLLRIERKTHVGSLQIRYKLNEVFVIFCKKKLFSVESSMT